MRKLLASAAIALASLAIATPASAFQATGHSSRDYNGSTVIRIYSQESGRSYEFYGTPASCGSSGADYDYMAYIINDDTVDATISNCHGNLVRVCLSDDYDNHGCSAYSKVRIRRTNGYYY